MRGEPEIEGISRARITRSLEEVREIVSRRYCRVTLTRERKGTPGIKANGTTTTAPLPALCFALSGNSTSRRRVTSRTPPEIVERKFFSRGDRARGEQNGNKLPTSRGSEIMRCTVNSDVV